MQNGTEIYYRGYQKEYGSQRTHLLWLTDDIEYAKEYGDTVEEYVIDGNKLNLASLDEMDEFGEYGEMDYYEGPSEEGAQKALAAGYNCYGFMAGENDSFCLCLWDKSPIISRRVLSYNEVEELIEKEYMNESKKPKKVVRNDEGKVVPEHCDCGGKVAVFIQGEPIYKCTACGKYYGTMPFHLKENKKKTMNKKSIKINETQLRQMIAESIKKILNEQKKPITEEILKENRIIDFFRNLFSKRSANKRDIPQWINIAWLIYQDMAHRGYYGDEIYDALEEELNNHNVTNPNDRKMISDGICKVFGIPNELYTVYPDDIMNSYGYK